LVGHSSDGFECQIKGTSEEKPTVLGLLLAAGVGYGVRRLKKIKDSIIPK
jgi:hypothetical protein